MNTLEFLDFRVGNWQSVRRYFYMEKQEIEQLITFLEVVKEENELPKYKVTWNTYIDDGTKENKKSAGKMIIMLNADGNLVRDRGYYTSDDTVSFVQHISEDVVKTQTFYGGFCYDERFTIISPNLLSRQTVGKNLDTNNVVLIGQYLEMRV